MSSNILVNNKEIYDYLLSIQESDKKKEKNILDTADFILEYPYKIKSLSHIASIIKPFITNDVLRLLDIFFSEKQITFSSDETSSSDDESEEYSSSSEEETFPHDIGTKIYNEDIETLESLTDKADKIFSYWEDKIDNSKILQTLSENKDLIVRLDEMTDTIVVNLQNKLSLKYFSDRYKLQIRGYADTDSETWMSIIFQNRPRSSAAFVEVYTE